MTAIILDILIVHKNKLKLNTVITRLLIGWLVGWLVGFIMAYKHFSGHLTPN